jgi:hypothetical protein
MTKQLDLDQPSHSNTALLGLLSLAPVCRSNTHRFSYANSTENIVAAMGRIRDLLAG